RILIVLIITLLLAQLFWTQDNDPVHTVKITEVEEESDQTISRENGDGFLEVELSSEKITEYKWWNLISQMDGDYQPDVIIAEGVFSRNRMGELRSGVSAEVQWINQETSDRKSIKTWNSGEDLTSSFMGEKVSNGVQYSVQELADIEILESGDVIIDADTIQFSGSVRMVIHENVPNSIQEGLGYTANYWNIDHEVGAVDGLMSVEMGDENWVLQRSESEESEQEWIEANRLTSIGMNVGVNNQEEGFDEVFLKTRSSNLPLFGKIDPYTFLVNGNVERDLESWFYAGVGHQIFKDILGIDEMISPTISDQERTMNTREASIPYRGTESKSVRLWLLGLLLVLWLTERKMAPARGM
ncbi:MAG: hypothetical protein WEA58_01900, partial [Balneolaceae bacterium]